MLPPLHRPGAPHSGVRSRFEPDRQLTARMAVTMFLLGLVYVAPSPRDQALVGQNLPYLREAGVRIGQHKIGRHDPLVRQWRTHAYGPVVASSSCWAAGRRFQAAAISQNPVPSAA